MVYSNKTISFAKSIEIIYIVISADVDVSRVPTEKILVSNHFMAPHMLK